MTSKKGPVTGSLTPNVTSPQLIISFKRSYTRFDGHGVCSPSS